MYMYVLSFPPKVLFSTFKFSFYINKGNISVITFLWRSEELFASRVLVDSDGSGTLKVPRTSIFWEDFSVFRGKEKGERTMNNSEFDSLSLSPIDSPRVILPHIAEDIEIEVAV